MTNSIRAATWVVTASCLVSAAAAAQEVAPSFPRDGAKKVFDNEVMTVWDVTWAKGKSTEMRQSRFDQVAVTLANGAVKVTRPDKSWTVEEDKLGSVRFVSKGTMAAEEGASDTPRRALVAEMKSYTTPALEPKVTQGLAEAKAKGIPGQFPRPGATKLFETDRLIVWDDTWPLDGKQGPLHAHYRTIVGLFVEQGELGAGTVRPVGWVNFSAPRIPPHTEMATKGPPRAIFIEIK